MLEQASTKEINNIVIKYWKLIFKGNEKGKSGLKNVTFAKLNTMFYTFMVNNNLTPSPVLLPGSVP